MQAYLSCSSGNRLVPIGNDLVVSKDLGYVDAVFGTSWIPKIDNVGAFAAVMIHHSGRDDVGHYSQ